MDKMDYPANYKDFIAQVILNPEIGSLTAEQVTTLFNLHNNYVDVNNPSFNKSCSSCIKETFQKVKKYYENTDSI